MEATKKLDKLNFNESVETEKVIPGMEEIMGKNMKFVGKSFHFVGDSRILQSINLLQKDLILKIMNKEK